jgi:hypothetical protein
MRESSAASQVELNPQPIPPGRELVRASAAVAHDIAFAVVAADATGADSASGIVSRAVDGWCGTPHPRGPMPWPSPWPLPPSLGPHIAPGDIRASRVVGALTFASVASRLAAGTSRDALSEGAERLLEAGVAQ